MIASSGYARSPATIPKIMWLPSVGTGVGKLDDSVILLKFVYKEDLVVRSKASNIHKLLDKAVTEGRVTTVEGLRYKNLYMGIENGDEALLHCLKVLTCKPDSFSELLNKVGSNQLHRRYAYMSPNSTWPEILKKSGNTAEHMMNQYYIRSGWRKIEGGIGTAGIDGLFIKKNRSGEIIDVMVVESKYNKGTLMQRKNGIQMSKPWILGNLDKLAKHYPSSTDYSRLKQFVENDAYRSRLWKMNVVDDEIRISTKKIHSRDAGAVIKELLGREKGKIEYNGNQVIDLLNPVNKFQQELVRDYEYAILNN